MKTFTVRVWIPEEGYLEDGASPLHGFIEHADGGGAEVFRSAEELLALIRAAISADVWKLRPGRA